MCKDCGCQDNWDEDIEENEELWYDIGVSNEEDDDEDDDEED